MNQSGQAASAFWLMKALTYSVREHYTYSNACGVYETYQFK